MRTTRPRPAFVALGANLGNRLRTLCSAAASLHRVQGCKVTASSCVFVTRAIGPSSEPFLNAVVRIETSLKSDVLLRLLTAIEDSHGRTREVRWGARTLDLDLLLVADGQGGWERRTDAQLELPHPRILRRDFVMAPLLQLQPDLHVGDISVVAALERLSAHERAICDALPDELTWVDAAPPPCATFPPPS